MELQVRIILLVVGLLILFGVAIDVFRRRALKSSYTAHVADIDIIEPELEIEIEFEPVGCDLRVAPVTHVAPIPSAAPVHAEPELIAIPNIIAIYIMARTNDGFNGAELLAALTSAHLYLEENNIFYRYEQDNGSGEVLFSIAKAVEPGYFNANTLRYEQVPGITLILVPSRLSAPLAGLDKLIRTAKQITFKLNGELLDHKRQPLTLHTIDSYKEQINTN